MEEPKDPDSSNAFQILEQFAASEAGVRTDHHGGKTWAPVGRTPVVNATGERKSVNMISVVSSGGQIHFEVFEGGMNATRFIEFCQKLLHDCPTPVFLIVDGSSVHTAKLVTEYVMSTQGQLTLFFLPPYSPELNPDEWVWKNIKHDKVLYNTLMDMDSELDALLAAGAEKARKRAVPVLAQVRKAVGID